jgi:hypothetical protein
MSRRFTRSPATSTLSEELAKSLQDAAEHAQGRPPAGTRTMRPDALTPPARSPARRNELRLSGDELAAVIERARKAGFANWRGWARRRLLENGTESEQNAKEARQGP